MPFDAFISYSHRDVALARDLKTGLERFARPLYRRRKLHVFRDDAVLSANAALWTSIREALDGSRYLVLVASPEAAASEWVDREAEYWCAHKPVANVLVVVARGGEEDLPPSLCSAFAEEPRFVDLRWAQEGRLSRRDPRFRDAVADLASPLWGRAKDELVGDDVRQRRNVLRLAWAIGIALAAATAAAIAFGASAAHERNVARSQRDSALSRGLAGTATASLAKRFDLAALLSIEAYRTRATPEAFDALFTAVQRSEPLVATLRSDGRAVASVAWSPDSRLVAAAGGNGTLRLWDPAARRSVASVREPGGKLVRSVAWGGGELVASGGDDGFVRFWRAPSLQPVGHIRPPLGNSVRAVAFSPDASLLASAGDDPVVRLWSAATHRAVGELDGHRDVVRGLAFSPDGRLLASASADETVRVWDVRRRAQLMVLPYGDVVRGVAFSPDGRLLAAGGDDDAVHLWSVRTGRPLGDPLRGPGSWVRTVAFSPDGRTLAAAGDDQSIVVWDVATRRQLGAPLIGNADVVRSLSFARDGRLVSGSEDGTVRLWDVDRLRPPSPNTTYGSLMRSAAIGAGGRLAVLGGSDGRVTVWSLPRGRLTSTLAGSASPVESVAVSRDGRLLAAGGNGGLVRVWRLPSLQPLGARSVHGAVYALRFSPDSRSLVSAGVDGRVRLWRLDAKGLRRARVLGTTGAELRSVAFDRTGDRVAAAGADGVVRTWEVSDAGASSVRTDEPVRVVASDGDRLALGNEDGSVRLRSAGGWLRLSGHTERVDSLAFDDRDRPLLISGSDDRTIRIWDARSGRELGDPIQAGNGVVLALGWTRGGALAWVTSDASFGARSSVLWSGDAAAYARRLCAVVGRDLSAGEWSEFIPRRYHSTCGFRSSP